MSRVYLVKLVFMYASFVLRLLVVGVRRVQLFLVPFFMLSLSYISPLGKPFPVPEQSIVIFYISLNPVLANCCVTQTGGMEIGSGVGLLQPLPYLLPYHKSREISKLYWYSIFSPFKAVSFVCNKFICIICGTCTMFGNTCLKWMFSWLFFSPCT